MKKPKNHRADYERRIATGLALGLTREESQGHYKSPEHRQEVIEKKKKAIENLPNNDQPTRNNM